MEQSVSVIDSRFGELALAIYIIVFALLLGFVGDFRRLFPDIDLLLEVLFWSVFFLAPLALGITVLVRATMADRNLRSFFRGGLAVVTLLVVIGSIYTYVNPPEGGGLMVAHLVSYGFGLVFSLGIVVERTIRYVISVDV